MLKYFELVFLQLQLVKILWKLIITLESIMKKTSNLSKAHETCDSLSSSYSQVVLI